MISLIAWDRFSVGDIVAVLLVILDTEAELRPGWRPFRVLVVANSDAQSGPEIARHLVGRQRCQDRLALVIDVDSVDNMPSDLMGGPPAAAWRGAGEAIAWLRRGAA